LFRINTINAKYIIATMCRNACSSRNSKLMKSNFHKRLIVLMKCSRHCFPYLLNELCNIKQTEKKERTNERFILVKVELNIRVIIRGDIRRSTKNMRTIKQFWLNEMIRVKDIECWSCFVYINRYSKLYSKVNNVMWLIWKIFLQE